MLHLLVNIALTSPKLVNTLIYQPVAIHRGSGRKDDIPELKPTKNDFLK